MKLALTGATGNMGQATLEQLVKIDEIEKIKILVLKDDKRIAKLLKKLKAHKDRIEVVFGNLADKAACEKLTEGVDYVVNLAAVIPPHSDKDPKKAVECNEIGVKTLVSVIEGMGEKQPKLIHTSTVALYGNRNSRHPWARVGDPLLVSPFDIYSATKLRGEFCVLESGIKNWAVLRQSAMLHHNMLSDNMSDGLMFHTCFNAPLEWVTAHDSGLLIANIIRRDMKEDLSKVFWKRVFNIGAGERNCLTGYDTLNDGFKIIGGSAKDFFQPNFNATRNFHGVWFYDSEKLDELFHYQTQSAEEFWKEFADGHGYFKLGKGVPKGLIRKCAIERLFKSPNAARYWVKHDDQPKVFAYFGGKECYDNIAKSWEDFGLLVENRDEWNNPIDYAALKTKKNAKLIDLGFDYDNEEITIKDLKNVAEMHGGKLLSKKFEDLYEKLEWQTFDGEVFSASAFSVLRAGHWMNKTYTQNVWDFDRLSKHDKIYAQLWYDSHQQDEDKFYYLDENFDARMKNL
ncbi:MAG: NAD-dependent epimerase/dehydratase family protein [Clostridia bacterium]|jgi:nucleoside-diphosphate-sugar epimerase|nr:NAD-dependent epimerase/dehydratase family protein [Clostridia bacterium]